MPQDDNWPDNTTAITGNTSVTDFSMEDMSRFNKASSLYEVISYSRYYILFLGFKFAVVQSSYEIVAWHFLYLIMFDLRSQTIVW